MDSVRDFKEIIKENKKMLYKLNQFGQIEISFDKLYEVKELLQLMNELLKIVNINNVVNNNLNFVFIVNNDQEEIEINKLIQTIKNSGININCSIKKNQTQQNTQELIAKIAEEIIKQGPTGQILKYIEFEGKLYENNISPSISDELTAYLEQVKNNPASIANISNMSQIQFENQCKNLMRNILKNRKAYELEQSKNINIEGENQEQTNITNDLIAKYDGKGNLELGIVKKGVEYTDSYTKNQFQGVEQNNITVLASNELNSNGQGNTNSSIDGVNYQTSNELGKENSVTTKEVTPRELPENQMFYIDEKGYIYIDDTYDKEPIGYIGDEQGYQFDNQGNLKKGDEFLGKTEKMPSRPKIKERKPDGYIVFMLFSVILSLMFVIYIVISLI